MIFLSQVEAFFHVEELRMGEGVGINVGSDEKKTGSSSDLIPHHP